MVADNDKYRLLEPLLDVDGPGIVKSLSAIVNDTNDAWASFCELRSNCLQDSGTLTH
jgi:hypothetical protein